MRLVTAQEPEELFDILNEIKMKFSEYQFV
jgi:hypothetical protein